MFYKKHWDNNLVETVMEMRYLIMFFKVHTPMEWGPSLAVSSVSFLWAFSHPVLIGWVKSCDIRNIDHSALSTRPHSSTSLVTSVKVSWLQLRTPEVSFENYTWFWLTQLNSTINGFDPELLNVRYENYNWFD